MSKEENDSGGIVEYHNGRIIFWLGIKDFQALEGSLKAEQRFSIASDFRNYLLDGGLGKIIAMYKDPALYRTKAELEKAI